MTAIKTMCLRKANSSMCHNHKAQAQKACGTNHIVISNSSNPDYIYVTITTLIKTNMHYLHPTSEI